MDTWIKKIKIKAALLAIGFIKKMGQYLSWSLLKVIKIIQFIFILFVKKIVIPLIFLFFKIKRVIRKAYSSFHYLEGNSFLNPQKILVVFLVIFLIFIFFESKTTLQEEFLAQAATADEQNNEINSDFKIAAEENPEVLKPIDTLNGDFVPTRTEIEKYIVEAGDTISSIAEDFGVSINTMLWENNLSPYSVIRPGQILKILPVSGVSYKVKRGDTIAKIAQVYRADPQDIINFNDLEGEPIVAGDTIIIPEGKIPPPPAPRIIAIPKQQKVWAGQFDGQTRVGNNCRNFYPGQCTWYVAQKYCIPWSGHAKSWLANAKNFGWAIGKTPRVGAIISIRETWYGHVAIVEEVRENTILISEMNYLGPWRVSKREISINAWRINGYIYP